MFCANAPPVKFKTARPLRLLRNRMTPQNDSSLHYHSSVSTLTPRPRKAVRAPSAADLVGVRVRVRVRVRARVGIKVSVRAGIRELVEGFGLGGR